MLKVLPLLHRKRNMETIPLNESMRVMIIRLRKLNTWSQQDLAGRSDCDKDTISKIERGVSGCSLNVAINIAASFGLSMNELTAAAMRERLAVLAANDKLMNGRLWRGKSDL
jgi:DNA-binding XRE family transcriptional regulator